MEAECLRGYFLEFRERETEAFVYAFALKTGGRKAIA